MTSRCRARSPRRSRISPSDPYWKAIAVPSDKNTSRPDLVFAHRLWYRTKVRVPEGCAGKSFYLVFPQNNLNTTVYVNGVYCGFDKNPFARVQIDVTKGIKPGVNEVWVGIRDAWYGYSANPKNPLKLPQSLQPAARSSFTTGSSGSPIPIWNHPQSGILVTPELVCAGPAYAADVFCKPSVQEKELAVDVTVSNGGKEPMSGEVICEAVNATGQVEKTFAPQAFQLDVHGVQVLAIADDVGECRNSGGRTIRDCTTCAPRSRCDGKVARCDGDALRLPRVDDRTARTSSSTASSGTAGPTRTPMPRRKNGSTSTARPNQTFMRFWGNSWMDLPPDEALDFFDKSGVVVRRSGMLDGEAIGYMAIEEDPDLKKEAPKSRWT